MTDTDENQLLKKLEQVLATERGDAFTMPGGFYTSESFLNLEMDRLFRKKWVCLGREEEIPEVGDYFSSNLANESIVIVRTSADKIKALSNVCRHRAMPLVAGAGHAKKFTCSYHAWTYDLHGKLVRAPGISEHHSEFLQHCHLPEFRCESWQGFIFVNLDLNSSSFNDSDTARHLRPLVENMHIQDMRLIYSSEQEWDANWKCLVENFLEGYHLSTVHRKTLHPYTPTELCQHFPPQFDYFGFYSYYPENVSVRGIPHPDVSEEEKNRSLMLGIGPSSVFGISGFKVTYNLIQPISATKLRTKIGMLAHRSDSEEGKKYEREGVELFTRTFAEDKEQLKNVMLGLKSKYYQSSVLAKPDYEGVIWDFYNYMARNLLGE